MAHYAKVENSLVTQVIVAESEFFDTFVDITPGLWLQTSYNTYGGVHSSGGTPLRKNFAGVGDTYDLTRDAFITPQPFSSWVLDESTCRWEAPVTRPDGVNGYEWDEDTTNWTEIT